MKIGGDKMSNENRNNPYKNRDTDMDRVSLNNMINSDLAFNGKKYHFHKKVLECFL
mgnify:CR=1 FL=1